VFSNEGAEQRIRGWHAVFFTDAVFVTKLIEAEDACCVGAFGVGGECATNGHEGSLSEG